MSKPAFLTDNEWHWRWQYRISGPDGRLHRVAEPFKVGRKAAWRAHKLTTICGITAWFTMPGVMSRLGAPRCVRCCRLLKIKRGIGNPYNQGIREAV